MDFPITIILIFTLFYVLYRFLTRNYNYWQSRGVPCDPPSLLFGNAWELFSGRIQVAKFLTKFYHKYNTKPYFGLYILDKPYLVLRDPAIIKRILIGDFNNFSDRFFACDKNADPMAGNSVFLLKNPRWRLLRSKLTSIFTSSKLKFMLPIMNNVGVDLENYLKNFNNQCVDMKEISAKYTTDVTALCFFGFHPNSFRDENNVFRIVGRKLFDFNILRISFSMFAYFFLPSLVSLMKLTFTDYQSTIFMRNLFQTTIKQRQQLQQVKRNDFVDLLLELKNVNANDTVLSFDDDTMVSQAITFFLAGFESTSNLISFTMYELCVHPDIQEKLRQEIHEFIKTDDDINYENLLNLKYMDMVLAESLRRYPFAPFLNRKCKDKYYIEESDYIIEPGTQILIPTDGIHYDPNYYPEPEKFLPERFADDVKFTSDVYMPFGSGPRFCIGDRFSILAAKISLIYYLKKYRFEKCAQTPDPIVLNPRSPFVMSNGGLPMIVKQI